MFMGFILVILLQKEMSLVQHEYPAVNCDYIINHLQKHELKDFALTEYENTH